MWVFFCSSVNLYLQQAEETEPFYNSQNTLNLIYNILILINPREFKVIYRGVAASRFVGRQDLIAYKGLVLTLGSMITIPMVWSM